MVVFTIHIFFHLFSPWRYSSLPSTQLKRLPVPLLASPDCLVVTWVTNRPSHLRFVRDELYPHWGVEVVAEWFWVKVGELWITTSFTHEYLTHLVWIKMFYVLALLSQVTSSGQFVFPLDSDHKKPYEVLVLGRYRSSAAENPTRCKMIVPVFSLFILQS